MESTSSQRFVREHDKIGWKNTTANANIGGVQYPFVNKKSRYKVSIFNAFFKNFLQQLYNSSFIFVS